MVPDADADAGAGESCVLSRAPLNDKGTDICSGGVEKGGRGGRGGECNGSCDHASFSWGISRGEFSVNSIVGSLRFFLCNCLRDPGEGVLSESVRWWWCFFGGSEDVRGRYLRGPNEAEKSDEAGASGAASLDPDCETSFS